jgi:hypothetical protein
VDGSPAATYAAGASSAALGAFNASDTRAFTLSESDAAGNESAQTYRLRAVPPVAGLTLDNAKAALAGRGFVAGAVTYVANAAAAGTVISPTGLSVAAEGTAVDLVVSTGPVPSPLLFSVAHASTFSWSTSRRLAVTALTSRTAQVTAMLIGPKGTTFVIWRFTAAPGKTRRLLVMPRAAKAGRYAIRWIATASGSSSVRKTTKLRVVGALPKSAPPGPLVIRKRIR